MNRTIGRLTALKVTQLQKHRPPGMHPDGGGLYLQVGTAGACSWVFRYGFQGKTRYMGFGSLNEVTLADARAKAAECRRQKANRADPLELQKQAHAQRQLAAAKTMTFQQCPDAYVKAKRDGWRNVKHAQQWVNTLNTYAGPVIGDLPVQEIDTALVVKVLQPIWSKKTETAARLRGRIEAVLDWAKSLGYRDGENPARWRGNLKHQLANPSKLRRKAHHSSLPHTEVGQFLIELRERAGTPARALEFVILTAARTEEALGARWDEIDLDRQVWTVPADRMKAGREHCVPLSKPALKLLEGQKGAGGAYVFPGRRPKRHLSNMALLMVLRRMKRDDATVHGFRSTFRNWVAERTSTSREVAEAALAHIAGDKVEAAYLHTTFFQKRQNLMARWAAYCGQASTVGKVIDTRAARSA